MPYQTIMEEIPRDHRSPCDDSPSKQSHSLVDIMHIAHNRRAECTQESACLLKADPILLC